jgi:hypothetical protein
VSGAVTCFDIAPGKSPPHAPILVDFEGNDQRLRSSKPGLYTCLHCAIISGKYSLPDSPGPDRECRPRRDGARRVQVFGEDVFRAVMRQIATRLAVTGRTATTGTCRARGRTASRRSWTAASRGHAGLSSSSVSRRSCGFTSTTWRSAKAGLLVRHPLQGDEPRSTHVHLSTSPRKNLLRFMITVST